MKVRIQKWGNSSGIRIPANIISDMELKNNDELNINVEDNRIILTKLNHKSIYERIDGYEEKYVCEEFAPYDVEGNELW